MTRIVVLIALVLLLAAESTVATQRRKPKPSSPSFVTMAPTRRVGAASVFYFSDRDTTRVELPYVRFDISETNYVALQVASNGKGATPTRPTAILFTLTSYSQARRFADSVELSLSCVGSDTILAYPSHSVQREQLDKSVLENAYFWIDTDEFGQFVTCGQLRIATGTKDYVFTHNELAAMKDLFSVVDQYPAPN